MKPSTHFGKDSLSHSKGSRGQKGFGNPSHVHHASNTGFVNRNDINSKPSGHATGAHGRHKKSLYTGGHLT